MKIKKDPKKEGFFLVESEHTPGKFYSVDPRKPFCGCADFRFREIKRHGVFKHIEAVRESRSKSQKPKHDKILAYVRQHSPVDSVELIDKFGEEAVNELIRKGEIIEKKGVIKLLD
ncbi:MAG: hypothetical protein KJ574_01620 [Nanoarchaeota archaeon]|nr:hypothetical protein [Nanoarchaeota archaeon]